MLSGIPMIAENLKINISIYLLGIISSIIDVSLTMSDRVLLIAGVSFLP
jgi:hypothetical protein